MRAGQSRQLRLLADADALAARADRALVAAWRKVLASCRQGNPLLGWECALDAARQLAPSLTATLVRGLRRAVRQAHHAERRRVLATVPRRRLERARERVAGVLPAVLALGRPRLLAEDEAAGTLVLTLDELLPAWTAKQLDSIVYGGDWQQRLRRMSSLLPPENVAQRVLSTLAKREGPRELARDLLPLVAGQRAVARRVAHDAMMHAAHRAQQAVHDQLGDLVVGYKVHATLDERTRPEHRARDGTVYYRQPGPSQKSMREMPQPPFEADGSLAYNCLLPGNRVQGQFDAALKAWYAGQAIEVRTRHGHRLTLTPNHPVCTTAGFKAAGSLYEGDALVCYSGDVRHLPGKHDDVDSGPARIEDVFCAAQQLWPTRVKPRSALDFHGDGACCQGNVEVVALQRVLGVDGNTPSTELFDQWHLVGADALCGMLPGERTFDAEFQTVALALAERVGTLNLVPPLVRRHAPPFDSLRIGPAAQLDASRYQHSHESGGTPDTMLAEVASGDAEFVRKLLQGFPREVTPDDVISVRHFEFAGHVYDLQSPYGWIVAENVFVSNCRCWLSPVLED